MAAKKATKKTAVKKKAAPKTSKKATKKVVKKATKKVTKKVVQQRPITKTKRLARATKRKIKIIINNILLFAVAMLIFLVLFYASNTEIYQNLFMLLAICAGVIVMAFLIVLLIFVLLRFLNK